MSHPAPHALDTPPWQRVETTMMELARDVRAAYDQSFEPLDLNLSQASLIGYIHENGPMNQTQLAAALVLGRAATGAVVDRLQARGLVRRLPDPDDRRVWMVDNTDDGSSLATDIIAVDVRLRKRLRVGISQAERRQLAELLLRMSANAEAAIADGETGPAFKSKPPTNPRSKETT